MSSSGPPPGAPTFEASKCALIMARALASVIENPPGTDAAWLGGAVRAAATSPSWFFGAATVRAEAASNTPWREPSPTRQRRKIAPAPPIGGRTTGPPAAAGQRDGAPYGRWTGFRVGRERASSQIVVASLSCCNFAPAQVPGWWSV